MRILTHMKKILLFTTVLFIPFINIAQEGQITIEKDENLDTLVKVYKDAYTQEDYFTIQIHSSVGRLAKAEQVASKAKIDFPGQWVKLDFEDQKYKVYIGKYKTRLEADRKRQQIRKLYSSAFIRPLPKKKKATR
jgi:hypothetical protein